MCSLYYALLFTSIVGSVCPTRQPIEARRAVVHHDLKLGYSQCTGLVHTSLEPENTMSTKQQTETKNKASQALFQLDFMVLMMNVGRDAEAKQAFTKCRALLEELREGGA